MHYANGRAAQVGDLVRGKGYNFKHEIIGKLIVANPGVASCNCTVACVTQSSPVLAMLQADGKAGTGEFPHPHEVKATFEYGQLDAFVALDPGTGEVLPPRPEDLVPSPAPSA